MYSKTSICTFQFLLSFFDWYYATCNIAHFALTWYFVTSFICVGRGNSHWFQLVHSAEDEDTTPQNMAPCYTEYLSLRKWQKQEDHSDYLPPPLPYNPGSPKVLLYLEKRSIISLKARGCKAVTKQTSFAKFSPVCLACTRSWGLPPYSLTYHISPPLSTLL